MISELVGLVEWWKMNEDQVRGVREWIGGDRVDWKSRYVMRTILKMMRLWIGNQFNCFRQSVLLRMGLRRTSLASLFCMRCKEWIKEVDGEEWTDMPNCPDEVIAWFDGESLRWITLHSRRYCEVSISSQSVQFGSIQFAGQLLK